MSKLNEKLLELKFTQLNEAMKSKNIFASVVLIGGTAGAFLFK